MACFLSLMLGSSIGWLAAWLEQRRGWDLAAFFRGALLGFVVANLLAIIDGALWGWVVESRSRLIGRLVLLGVCLLLGGLIGLSRLKSNARGGEVQSVEGQASSEQAAAAAGRHGRFQGCTQTPLEPEKGGDRSVVSTVVASPVREC